MERNMTLSFKKSFSTLYSDEHLFGVHVCLHVFFYNEVGGGDFQSSPSSLGSPLLF